MKTKEMNFKTVKRFFSVLFVTAMLFFVSAPAFAHCDSYDGPVIKDAVKAFETKDAIANGADEIDMVINIGALKDGNTDLVFNDIKAVVDAAAGKCVKVIIETCLLTDEEIVTVCKLAKEAQATFVKTSTGFSTGGATPEAVSLMKQTVGDDLEVKASGGVRTIEDMEKVVAAGATRIGTSAGCKLVKNNNS